jgi:hypothetical protein
MQQWADHLDALRADGGNVVAIGQGRKAITSRPPTGLKAKP